MAGLFGGTVGALLAGAVLARTLVTETVFARALVTGTILAGSIITRTVVARPVVTGPVVVARTVVAVAPAVAAALAALALALTFETVAVLAVAGTVVALSVFPGAIIPRTIVARPVVTGPVITGTVVALAVLEPVAAAFALLALAALAVGLGLGLGRFGGFGLLLRLGLEVDLVGRIGVLADDVADRPIRLDGAQDADIVLGVLQVVLGQHPVAGRRRVAGQLLVLFVNALGGAAHLDALGTVRIEGPVGVVLLRLAAATRSAAIVAAALALHALEISHVLF